MPSVRIIDPFKGSHLSRLPNSLNLSLSSYNEASLIRLLLGTADIELAHEGLVIKQRMNLSNALGARNNYLSPKILRKYLFPLTISDLDSYLRRTSNTNHSIFNDLIYEYSNYFICTHKNNHTSAFVYLYRILEFISYSFPLMHASASHNYTGTFRDLQSYFTKEGNELAFLLKFTTKLFDGDPIIVSTADIEVKAQNLNIQEDIYKSYKRIIPHLMDSYEDANLKFSIQYAKLIEVIIFIRNRYFHFAVGGQKNIRTADINYPDIFFSQINSVAINWLSIIYFEILKSMVDRWR